MPDLIDKMIASNEEMNKDTGPDDTADYWEEKDKI
jgi:hypothetical protein